MILLWAVLAALSCFSFGAFYRIKGHKGIASEPASGHWDFPFIGKGRRLGATKSHLIVS